MKIKKKINKFKFKKVVVFIMFNIIFTIILAPFIIFWGPFEAMKSLAVGSVLTSRHPQVVKAFLSDDQIDEIVNKYNNTDTTSNNPIQRTVSDASTAGVACGGAGPIHFHD